MATASSDTRSALILYGSETGNAYDIAQEISRICERLRFATKLQDLNSIPISSLLQSTFVLVVISTTGQGDLPANAQSFWKALRSVRLKPSSLASLSFASFGLGDSSYPKFNWAHRKLYNRLIQLGANPFCDKGEADEQHPEGVDATFVPWLSILRARLLELSPLPIGIEPIPDSINLEPLWILDEVVDYCQDNSHGSLSTNSLIPIPNSIVATVHSNTRITSDSHYQDTRHLILDLPNEYDYMPGDTLSIYPKNFDEDVLTFIQLMSWESVADTPLKFNSNKPDASTHSLPFPQYTTANHPVITIRKLLTDHLDIMAIPRRSFFVELLHHTNNEMHIERLNEFISPDLIDELYDYTTRPRRSILEVLSDFTSVKLPWNKICSILPPMRGRQFSIASGGQLKTLPHSNSRVELLIAIVKYRTILRRIRNGVATRYIATLFPGQLISVTLQKGSLNITQADILKPVIMIAPGTGVAPMRSLIWERKLQREKLELTHDHQDVLIFGCRKKDADEYFKHEWSGLGVQVFTAYSREQKTKVYVQDIIKEQGKIIFEALAENGGLVFVCGSSGRMPQAVRHALTEVFQIQGHMLISDAEAYLSKMEKDGRYKQETW